jgi:hypothetical protein
MATHHDASSFGILIEGSVEKIAEAKVQRSNRKTIRSNPDLRKPACRVAIVRKIQPKMAIPMPIALAATE